MFKYIYINLLINMKNTSSLSNHVVFLSELIIEQGIRSHDVYKVTPIILTRMQKS